jgi:hypothetical protein
MIGSYGAIIGLGTFCLEYGSSGIRLKTPYRIRIVRVLTTSLTFVMVSEYSPKDSVSDSRLIDHPRLP